MPRDRTEVLTLAALCAFAANSILCRLALGGGLIDAATFTVARVGSGALALIVLARLLGAAHPASGGSWPSAWLLFLYAVCFSFSYLSLSAATGALILFASVQITMIAWGLLAGERPTRHEWIGLVLAFGGLVGLVAPGLTAPAPVHAASMACAGVSWGFYSQRGRGVVDPVLATCGNFIRAVGPALLVSLMTLKSAHASGRGILLAVLSGAFASGMGYVAWYAALKRLSAMAAAIAQLCVPVLVVAAGVVLLSEPLTARLVITGLVILSGAAWARLGRRASSPAEPRG